MMTVERQFELAVEAMAQKHLRAVMGDDVDEETARVQLLDAIRRTPAEYWAAETFYTVRYVRAQMAGWDIFKGNILLGLN